MMTPTKAKKNFLENLCVMKIQKNKPVLVDSKIKNDVFLGHTPQRLAVSNLFY